MEGLPDLVAGAAERHVPESAAAASAPGGLVRGVEFDAVAAVNGEVTLMLGGLLDFPQPLIPAGKGAYRVGAAELVGAVERQCPAWTAGRAGVLGVVVLALIEHRAPGQIGGPGVVPHEVRHLQGGEEAVAKLASDLIALGPESPD
jgi:hypothetical protein